MSTELLFKGEQLKNAISEFKLKSLLYYGEKLHKSLNALVASDIISHFPPPKSLRAMEREIPLLCSLHIGMNHPGKAQSDMELLRTWELWREEQKDSLWQTTLKSGHRHTYFNSISFVQSVPSPIGGDCEEIKSSIKKFVRECILIVSISDGEMTTEEKTVFDKINALLELDYKSPAYRYKCN